MGLWGQTHAVSRRTRDTGEHLGRTGDHRFASVWLHRYPTIDLAQPRCGIFSRTKPRHLTLPPGRGPLAKARADGPSFPALAEVSPTVGLHLPDARIRH